MNKFQVKSQELSIRLRYIQKIPIKIKTLYGNRKEYMFNLKPEDKIGKVIKEIQNEENNDKSTKEKISPRAIV